VSLSAPLVAEARGTTRRVARTFSLACRLLPKELRDDVYLLYLVFRTLDDLVDEGRPEAEERIAAVEAWCNGNVAPATLETTILHDLRQRHPIPTDALRDFCAGMRHDLAGAPLHTEDDVDRYCYQVAGTVGVVMAHVLGTHDPGTALPAAAALGMAMQRTNILRDVDEDACNGRAYLAADTVRRLGGSLVPGAREHIMRDQIARADALYDQGCAGITELRHGRRAVAAAAVMYREILRQIEREGYGASPGRAVVARSRKLLLAARGGVLAR
jgi:phytoene synthase